MQAVGILNFSRLGVDAQGVFHCLSQFAVLASEDRVLKHVVEMLLAKCLVIERGHLMSSRAERTLSKDEDYHNLSRDARKPVFGVSDQVRHKPSCTSSEKS